MRGASPAPSDSLYTLPPIVVEAKRPDRRSDPASRSGFVAVVDMKARAGRVDDVATVLSQLVGVRVTQYGGLGSFATVSIRGSSSNQVRTFLDGIPIDDPYLGVTNLADLPLSSVSRVEVYRGFSPPQLGGSAIGGAVNLTTREDATRTGLLSALELQTTVGSFDTQRQSASLWSHPHERFKFFAHGNYEKSVGDFTFHNDNGTPQNPDDDDEAATRLNNDFTGWNAMLRATTSIAHVGSVAAAYNDLAREQGVPGQGAFQSLTARSDRHRRMGYANLEGAPLLGKQLLWWTSGFYQRANEKFHDPDADASLVRQDTDNTIDTYGGQARTRWLVPWVPVAIDASFDGRKETYHPISNVPTRTEGPDRWRHATTAAIGADVYLFRQSLVLTATQRFEENEDQFFAAPRFPWLPPTPEGRVTHREQTPSGGVRWQPVNWLVVKGNVGRYYRLPTFLELFGNTGSVTGNSELEPETGENRDVGIALTVARIRGVRRLFFEATYLDNTVEDLILFFLNSQYTTKPVNIGAAHVRGWEFATSAAFAPWLEVAAGYTHLDTEDTSEIPYYSGNELPTWPRDDVNASASLSWRALRATYEFQYMSANWLDRANLRETPSRALHGVVLTLRTPLDGLSFTLEGRNLTDERPVDVADYPLPGRSFFSTLGYRY